MKTPRIVNAIEYIDEDMITEAASYSPKKHTVPTWTKWVAVAACFCLCIMGAFKIRNLGMGKTQKFYNISTVGENVYYSVWNEGTFRWNPSMKNPEKLADYGEFFETESGLILYSPSENALWNVSENKLEAIGKTDIQNILDSPKPIGILNDCAYWVGTPLDMPQGTWGMAIVRTSLADGKAETVLESANSSIASCTIRDGKLYYRIFADGSEGRIERLYAKDLESGEETLLAEMPIGVDGLSGQIYYAENYILIVGGSKDGIYKMSYGGGEAELLTQSVPITGAMDEWNGKIYFETSFGENESEEFLSGSAYYSEELVSVDLESRELTRIGDFALLNDDGTVRYTLTELEMADGGFYFVDPQSGLFFHSFADGTDTNIH